MEINRIRPVEPTPGTDAAKTAYAVHLDAGPVPQTIVEYAAGGGEAHASEGHVRSVVKPYLDRGEVLPARIDVDRDGNARARG